MFLNLNDCLCLPDQTYENIVAKKEIARNEHFFSCNNVFEYEHTYVLNLEVLQAPVLTKLSEIKIFLDNVFKGISWQNTSIWKVTHFCHKQMKCAL